MNDCHANTMSSVVVNQCQSIFYPVLERISQCGVLSHKQTKQSKPNKIKTKQIKKQAPPPVNTIPQ